MHWEKIFESMSNKGLVYRKYKELSRLVRQVTQLNMDKILEWKILKCENYKNVTQRKEMSKCCWKNGTLRLQPYRIATNL